MPRRKPPVATRHGATQPEDARRNAQVLLRLAPAVRDILRDQSAVQGIPVSGLVAELVLRTWGHQYNLAEHCIVCGNPCQGRGGIGHPVVMRLL